MTNTKIAIWQGWAEHFLLKNMCFLDSEAWGFCEERLRTLVASVLQMKMWLAVFGISVLVVWQTWRWKNLWLRKQRRGWFLLKEMGIALSEECSVTGGSVWTSPQKVLIGFSPSITFLSPKALSYKATFCWLSVLLRWLTSSPALSSSQAGFFSCSSTYAAL